MTLTTTPARRCLNCGSTACVSAIVPNMLVSNSSRIVVIGVASNGEAAPKPALLTRASIAPAAAMSALDASGIGDVECEQPKMFGARQRVLARRCASLR